MCDNYIENINFVSGSRTRYDFQIRIEIWTENVL